jgi:hypothetical protein
VKPGAWRTTAGHLLAVAVAVSVAGFAFLYRFNALGGSLGGFDNDDFVTLTRVDMVLAGAQPLRDFADAKLRGAWPALGYEVPAWAQRTWGRSLLTHAHVTVGVLAVCAGAVFLIARHLSRRWVIALLAAAVVVVSGAKLYNYPKVLALTVGVAAIRIAVTSPTRLRLAIVAAWTVVVALFRHDYGAYVAVGTIAGLIALQPRPWHVAARRVATYAGLTAILALPSLIWVARYAGITRYLQEAIITSRTDVDTRRLHDWPVVDLAAPFAEESLIAFNYYAFWALPLAAVAMLAWLWRAAGAEARGPERAFGCALVALTLLVNYLFLRSNLTARFGDASVAVVLLAAWLAGMAVLTPSPVARTALLAGPALLLVLMFGAFIQFNSIARELETGGILVSAEETYRRFHEVRRTLRALPPEDWAGHEARGSLTVARYLAECTAPDDLVLMGTYADEIPYYARRRFAAGQGLFAFGFSRGEADQRLALERLQRQSVPVAVMDADYEHEFGHNYPLLASHLAHHYRDLGVIPTGGEPRFRLFVEAARRPRGVDPRLGIPCFR